MSPPSHNLRRRRPSKAPSKLIILVCGGQNTEPSYFSGLAQEFRKSSVQIEISGAGLDPRSLVEDAVRRKKQLLREARKSKNSFDKNFEIWAVFDRDEFPQIHEAREIAKNHGINIAESNPCFEVWGIYHYQECNAPDDGKKCQRVLSSLCQDYDRSGAKLFRFESLGTTTEERVAKLELACSRSATGIQRRLEEGTPNGRPSSEVHMIVEVVRNC